ncbi:hypothetical protein F5888DRAFT_1648162 [Russula emetica]|nr:hypothetical protein F5888DRAFT_1648162 [Russula emetica]
MLQFRPDSENHILLFSLAASSAAVELGLTAYLMIAGSHVGGVLYHSLFVVSPRFVSNNRVQLYCRQILFLLDALWTVLFLPACVLWFARGSLDLLANIFGSIFWVFAAAFIWGSAIGWAHNTRARKSCRAIPSDSRCTYYISPGSLAWMELALCVVTLSLAIIWMRGSRIGRGKQHPRFNV